jgi:hypothetical protein
MKYKIVEIWEFQDVADTPQDFYEVNYSIKTRFCSIKAAEKFIKTWTLPYSSNFSTLFTLEQESIRTKEKGWGFTFKAVPE